MNLQFADGFPGDEASGAIGPLAYHHKRAEMPVEVDDVLGEALLRTTWRKRAEVPVEGQAKPKVVYSNEPVFALVEDAPVAEQQAAEQQVAEESQAEGEGQSARPRRNRQ